jgi:hypothetical protein
MKANRAPLKPPKSRTGHATNRDEPHVRMCEMSEGPASVAPADRVDHLRSGLGSFASSSSSCSGLGGFATCHPKPA